MRPLPWVWHQCMRDRACLHATHYVASRCILYSQRPENHSAPQAAPPTAFSICRPQRAAGGRRVVPCARIQHPKSDPKASTLGYAPRHIQCIHKVERRS
jgi:hypothetical protein